MADTIAGADWQRHAARIIEQLETPGLPGALFAALDSVVANDGIVVFGYRPDQRPDMLSDNVGPEERRHIRENYIGRTYLLGPAYRACVDGLASGIHGLRDVAPTGFYQSEFFRRYYKGTNLIDEAYHVTQLGGGRTILMSIARDRPGPAFTKRNLRDLRGVEPVLRAAVSRHWQGFGRQSAATDEPEALLHKQLETAFRNFGSSMLTQRECEVVRMLLQGHSGKSAADRLEISPETVKFHRKRIYEKLDIASQAELFSLFLGVLGMPDAGPDQDPLIAYHAPQRGGEKLTAI